MNSATDRPVVSFVPPLPARSIAAARVCVVSGQRDEELLRSLARAGHEVTAVSAAELPAAAVPVGGSAALQASYRVYEWLRPRSFDAVVFDDYSAPGYYSLLARRQGLAFEATTFCLALRAPTLWQLEQQGAFLDRIDHLEADSLERRCVELADAVWDSPDNILTWMQEQGWPEPRRLLTSLDFVSIVPAVPSLPQPLPLVSVCLVHHDRPGLLRQALASLAEQDYPHVEVVLVDDGSATPKALEFLAHLEPLFLARGWPLIRQPNRYLGAARNTAARHARGEYLLFMDDDNVARPHEISTFVRAAQHSGADILTTFIDFFNGELPPDPKRVPLCRWLFAGVDSPAGIARNCFGDANALVRRSTFERLGGFTEDRGTTHEDWEFFAKAVLHGCTLEVVPEALVWYRFASDSMIRSTSTPRNYARSLRPYLEDVPAPYRDLIRLMQGQALCNERLRRFEEKPLRYRIADTLYRWLNRLLLRRFDP